MVERYSCKFTMANIKVRNKYDFDLVNQQVHNPDCMVAREIPGVGMSDEAKLFHDLNADMIEHFSHMSVKSDLSRVEPGQVSEIAWISKRLNRLHAL